MSDDERQNLSEEDDLFGDDDDAASEKVRQLSDEDLDSGDDEGRNDRVDDKMDGVDVGDSDRHAFVMDVDIGRHDVPRPSDGQVSLIFIIEYLQHKAHYLQLSTFRIPAFIGLAPLPYESATFTPPSHDHHVETRSEDFSSNIVAQTTMRYRKNVETGKLESNTLFSQWSDGSVTLHIGDNDYELQAKPLAPPTKDSKGYQEVLDSYQYLAAPHFGSHILQIIGHITNQYSVEPNKQIADAALEKLAVQLQAATRGRNKGDNKDGIALITNTQDPELQKKEAEQAEKERMKAQRRREAAAIRADQRTGRDRVVERGGLSLDDLEGGRGRLGGSRKKRSAPSGPRKARKRADYSSDEDEGPRGRNREDEYDMEDDFLAASDEELEEGDGSEEEIDEGSEEEESPKPKKQKTSKPANEDSEADADADVDAEGEDDDDLQSAPTGYGGADASGRGRKRLIIEDDDDE
jgi:RNA polymerase-associated protein LEO1